MNLKGEDRKRSRGRSQHPDIVTTIRRLCKGEKRDLYQKNDKKSYYTLNTAEKFTREVIEII